MVVVLSSDEEDTEKMAVDLSSDEEDTEKMVIDLSSDDEDSDTISWNFHSDLANKRKGADEMVSSASRRRNTKGKRAESEMKKLEQALIPGVSAAAVPKESRKEKIDEWAMTTYSASETSNKLKVLSVSTYKKIPRVHLRSIETVTHADMIHGRYSPAGIGLKLASFHTHTSLVGKRVILYGLPGYHHYNEYELDVNVIHAVWRKFYFSRIVPPALEFVEQADILKENGVDQILFIAVNSNSMDASMNDQPWASIRSKYPFVRVLHDSKYCKPKLRSFYRGLHLGPDICEGWIPPRCRRYIFLVDDNKVKYSSIETSDQVFILPSTEEIIEAFSG